MLKAITIETLVDWSKSEVGGLVIGLSHENHKTVSYYLKEFALSDGDPMDDVGAIQLKGLIVVGKKWFLDDVLAD